MKTNNNCDYTIIDATLLLYRSYYVNRDEEEMTQAGLAIFNALLTINKYYKAFKPRKRMILLFDRPNWRKPYTESDLCLSKKIYKANRRKDQTQSQIEKFAAFKSHMSEFESMMKKFTSVVCLSGTLLEADDIAGGFVNKFSHENEIVVVSADKDYIQLLGCPNTRLIDPATGKDRTLDEWQGDAELFMFEKCIRGDAGDNVQSAFPRCRKTRILKAYTDPLEHTNLMHETWTHVDGRTITVKDMFQENMLLMGLTHQPPEIQELIQASILSGMANPGKFNHFKFLKFCGKFELKKVAEQAEQFIPLLNS